MNRLCVDTSAWHRSGHAVVRERWSDHLSRDELAVCDQVRLEVLWSARSPEDYRSISQELAGLWPIPMGSQSIFDRALEVQAKLAAVGGLHHRSVKIADLLIAAAAEAVNLPILHYDADFERIASITEQPHSWIAPRGSL